MKNKIQNIILYIINIILIGFIILSNKNFILNNSRITLKNMNESRQVTELNKTIETLNNTHTEYANYIQTSKNNLATIITNAGVTTNGTDTFETIINNVSNIISINNKPDITWIGLIINQYSVSGWVTNTEVSNYTSVGRKTIIDNGAFDFEDSSKFICKANGTVRVFGSADNPLDSPTIYVYKNDILQNNNGSTHIVFYEFDVSENDYITVQYAGGKSGYSWRAGLSMIFSS